LKKRISQGLKYLMAKENVKEDYFVGQALKKARYAETE